MLGQGTGTSASDSGQKGGGIGWGRRILKELSETPVLSALSVLDFGIATKCSRAENPVS